MTQNKKRGCPKLWRAAMLLLVLRTLIGQDAVPGWFKAGSHPKDYDMGIDASVTQLGKPSGFIKASKADPQGFGTFMQMFDAGEYLGKRVRFSALVKSENVDNWTSLWMRVDGPGKAIAFDNMQSRQIKGTQTWTRHSVVLDVDSKLAVHIAFGVMLAGKGAVWISDVRFETVGLDVPVTDMMKSASGQRNTGPRNLDFEKK